MNISKEFTTITPLSKALALTLFIALPIITFSLGMSYQSKLQSINNGTPPAVVEPTSEPVACTEEAKICPDGSSVGRVGPNCEFEKCPDAVSTSKIFTGTITSINYQCHMDGICSVQIGKGSLILEHGETLNRNEVKGSYPADLLNETSANNYIGKQVEVYAATVGGRTDSYTIFGSKLYYIKLIGQPETQAMCGGIAGKLCPEGYYCKYDGTYPDAAGKCLKLAGGVKATYTCPKTQYVNCMPGPSSAIRTECSTAFLKWATANCPGFQGAAL
jgi:hypothetical protein